MIMNEIERKYMPIFMDLVGRIQEDAARSAQADQTEASSYMNTREAAKYLGVSKSKVAAMTKAGELEFHQPHGPNYTKRFTKKQLDNFFK